MNEEYEKQVETIMLAMGYKDYKDYVNEKERNYWRKFVKEDENDTMVREQRRQNAANC